MNPNITLRKGDLVKEIHEGKHDYVLHAVDCSNNWNEKDSLSAALNKQYELSTFELKHVHAQNNVGRLGHVGISSYYLAHVDKNVVFFTLYTTIDEKAKDPEYNSVNYYALALCLYKVKLFLGSRKKISMGTLCMGGQKGDKDKVGKLVKKYLDGFDVELIIKK